MIAIPTRRSVPSKLRSLVKSLYLRWLIHHKELDVKICDDYVATAPKRAHEARQALAALQIRLIDAENS